MTTRDPRSRDPRSSHQGVVRDPTQSLSIDPADEVGPDSGIQHPSLALGTHEAKQRDEEGTKVESPAGRVKTPAPPRPVTKPPPAPRTTVDDPDNRIGTMLGSYRVTELLGKGGMGYVYRAEHTKLGREVALKLLRTDYAKRKDAVARFIQEARTVNRIRHRNIVDVPDILELEDGTTCIVMELLRGQSLGKWARTGIDLPRALAVLVQICDGLGAAHSVSIVHRDLKPDNVIVVPTSDGAELVKLLDFGVAKLLNRDDEDVGFQTAAGSVIGTPAYMSPEQAGGMPIDARSDIYSLGAIMYELFCGQPMFRGRSFGEYVRKHLTEMPIRPKNTTGGAALDDRLEAIILRALEKDPNQRYQHIVELRDSLLAVLGGLETMPPPSFATMTASGIRPIPLPPQGPMQHLPTLPPVIHAPTPAGTHSLSQIPLHQSQIYGAPYYSQIMPQVPVQPPTPWWVWFIGGAIAVGLGVGGAVWFAGRTSEPAPQPAPTPEPAPIKEPTLTPDDPPPVKAKLVEVRFDSLPSGAVFADGQSAELCTTPCTINVDLDDGGSTETRTFIVKSPDHKDGEIVVDLTSSKREYNVRLEQLVSTKTAGETTPTKTTKPKTTKVTKQPDKVSTQPDKPDKKAGTPDTTTTDDPPPEKKPEKKPGDKIDRSDTLDPFNRKRP